MSPRPPSALGLRPSPGFETAVFRLPKDGGEGRRLLEIGPSCCCKPYALLLWKSAPGSRVHQLSVNLDGQLRGAVPAVMFEAEVAWSYFASLLHRRPDGVETVDSESVGKFFRFSMPFISLGHVLGIDIEGRFDSGVVLARTPVYALPEAEPGILTREASA